MANNIIWQPHPGPQTRFLQSGVRDIFYGGAAGGGKSDALIAAGSRFFALPYYRGRIFRRSRTQATELIIKAKRVIPRTFPGAIWRASEWAFIHPSGGRLEIGYLRHDDDLENEQGQEYAFCVAKGTPILMADGTHKPVEAVSPGDLVMTLQGPAPVTLRTLPVTKPCLSITIDGKTTVASYDHRVLTPSGWASLEELIPTVFRSDCTNSSASQSLSQAPSMPCESRRLDLQQGAEPDPPAQGPGGHQGTAASSATVGIGCGAFGHSRLASQPLVGWSVLLMLHEPAPQSGAPCSSSGCRPHECAHDLSARRTPDSQFGCHAGCGCGDAQSHAAQAVGPGDIPLPVGAGTHSPQHSSAGDRAKTQGCSRSASCRQPFAYFHPYTMASQRASEGVRLAQAWLAPADEEEVYDLRVAGYSHYITSSGIISQNCGFDELTQFPEHQPVYLFSRLRSPQGLPLQFKATGNPGGIGHLWVKARYIDPAPPETVIWDKFKTPTGKVLRFNRMFIPARLEDNPSLGDDYEISMSALDPRTYMALRLGNWDALLGQAFPDFDRSIHVMTWQQFFQRYGHPRIPEHWPRFMSIDWGSAKPFSVGWNAVDPFGRLIRYAEWYGAATDRNGRRIPNKGIHLPTRDMARGILERESIRGDKGRVELRVADPAMWNKTRDAQGIEGPSLAEIFADEGVHLTPADNSRIAGKQQYHDRFRLFDLELPNGDIEESPGFFVMENCVDWLRTVPVLDADPHRPEDVNTDMEDHCLVAGTLIKTMRGDVPIEALTPDDRVMTRKGWRHCLPYGVTKAEAKVYRLELEDGSSIVGTANHPVWIEGRGWVRIDETRYGDKMLVWQTSKKSGSTASSSEGTPIRPDGAIGCISSRRAPISNEGSRTFIEKSGSLFTGQFQKGTMFTTSTITLSTTIRLTSNASRSLSTFLSIPERTRKAERSTTAGFRSWPESGTEAMRPKRFIQKSPKGPGSGAIQLPIPASTAVALTKRGPWIRASIAPTSARLPLDAPPVWTMSSENASCADPSSLAIAMLRNRPAPVSAVRVLGFYPAGIAPVYNLLVESEHEYFANGILVSNCYDEQRYLFMARTWTPPTPITFKRWQKEYLPDRRGWKG